MKYPLLATLVLAAALPLCAETFDPTVRYSRLVTDACIYHFKANTRPAGFAKYDAQGNLLQDSESERGFDYVPGLVAKAVLEATVFYQDSAFAAPWFYAMQAYGDRYYSENHSTSNTLDDLNACKLYFPLADLTATGARFANSTTHQNALTAQQSALEGLEKYNNKYVIELSTSQSYLGSDAVAGGWWHKDSYENEMWCDGLYMGPALLAELLHRGYSFASLSATDAWTLVAKQFHITWSRLWDADKQLLYHAFSADPAADTYWADQTPGNHYGVSAEFWARADGWYFLALVDVLELMPASHPDYAALRNYLNALAAGLALRQDAATGCWPQLLQYPAGTTPEGCSTANYLESSASAIFTAAYLKGTRLGLFDTDYTALAQKAYQGLITQFLRSSIGDNNPYALIDCCASAGLNDKRKGDAVYYLSGSDTGRITTYTEGKVLGAFILAAIEYERAYMSNPDPSPDPDPSSCHCLTLSLPSLSN